LTFPLPQDPNSTPKGALLHCGFFQKYFINAIDGRKTSISGLQLMARVGDSKERKIRPCSVEIPVVFGPSSYILTPPPQQRRNTNYPQNAAACSESESRWRADRNAFSSY
jgi:hypothetical protein